MAIVRWKPFRAMTSMERQMRDLQSFFDAVGEQSGRSTWSPAMDVFRRNGTLVLEAELPGIDPKEDIDIEIEDGMLNLTGERSESRETEENGRFITERRFGRFQRNLVLPDGVDPDSVKARYEDGLLTIEVPVPEDQDTGRLKRKVDVEVG